MVVVNYEIRIVAVHSHAHYVNGILMWNSGMQHYQTARGRAWQIKGLYTDGRGPHQGSLPGAPCRCASPQYTTLAVVGMGLGTV